MSETGAEIVQPPNHYEALGLDPEDLAVLDGPALRKKIQDAVKSKQKELEGMGMDPDQLENEMDELKQRAQVLSSHAGRKRYNEENDIVILVEHGDGVDADTSTDIDIPTEDPAEVEAEIAKAKATIEGTEPSLDDEDIPDFSLEAEADYEQINLSSIDTWDDFCKEIRKIPSLENSEYIPIQIENFLKQLKSNMEMILTLNDFTSLTEGEILDLLDEKVKVDFLTEIKGIENCVIRMLFKLIKEGETQVEIETAEEAVEEPEEEIEEAKEATAEDLKEETEKKLETLKQEVEELKEKLFNASPGEEEAEIQQELAKKEKEYRLALGEIPVVLDMAKEKSEDSKDSDAEVTPGKYRQRAKQVAKYGALWTSVGMGGLVIGAGALIARAVRKTWRIGKVLKDLVWDIGANIAEGKWEMEDSSFKEFKSYFDSYSETLNPEDEEEKKKGKKAA